ncbi:response regulator transcription factor [uncultured Sphingomonas sp.]|uniref:response regulator transcription factor n=1 Tax=uncultured Sphingomonas sp. TaxID=158754 RepID=UPI0025DAF50E|nr:response regulator transcription factor [uncultured Sphingomonas sp.]
MRLLIAEDDAETAAFLGAELRVLGHEVVHAADGEAALAIALESAFDLLLLDRMLPALDGISVLRALRDAQVRTPVLMLTALGGIGDRVEGLDAGADDYLVKPFAIEELIARLHALGRRLQPDAAAMRLAVGDVTLDLLRREAVRGGRAILLQPREFALLEQLMRNAGRVVTRTMLLEHVWGFTFDPTTNIVESNLSRLRAKLNHGFDRDPIETVRGLGYRMLGDG